MIDPSTNARLPDFLVIGAMKAGTTSLFHDLNSQPGVFIPSDKEPHTLQGDTDECVVAEYARILAGAGPDDLCGDASTGYTKLPVRKPVAERAARLLGDQLKVIYLVRNPIDRMLSHYHHAVTEGSFSGSLADAVEGLPGMVDYSLYGMQAKPWFDALDPDRVRVVLFEDYVRNRAGAVASMCEFLGLDFDLTAVSDEKHNASDGKPRVHGALRRVQFIWPYRVLIRPLLRPEVRVRLVRRFVPKAEPRPTQMPESVYAAIADRLADDERLLADLTGLKRPIFHPLRSVEASTR